MFTNKRNILTGLGICSILFGIFLWYDIHTTLVNRKIGNYGSIILQDANGNILTDKGLPEGYMTPWTGSLDIPLITSIIQIEDKRFYDHSGIDIIGKFGSIWENLRAGYIIRGGSTITEQYVKNVYFRGEKRTYRQKLREAILAIYLEQTETKETILRGYLNNIYFGKNIYGINTLIESLGGSENIQDHDIADIITFIKYPNINKKTKDSAGEYRNLLIKRLSLNTINEELKEVQGKNGFERFPLVTQRIQKAVSNYCLHNDPKELLLWIKNTIPSELCLSKNIHLKLALDGNLMEQSRLILDSTLKNLISKNVTNGAIFIYHPKQKKIITYIGSFGGSPGSEQIDMIIRRRSVGSILKPFIFLKSLELGNDGNEFILDDTKIYPTGHGTKVFIPLNYSEKSFGPVRLSEALGNSLNSSTVRLAEKIGIEKIYTLFKEFGLDLDNDVGYYGYSLVLGGPELTLENIVFAYSKLINFDDMNRFLLSEILKDPQNRMRTFGISSILGTTIPLAVKTGTSTDFRDNWTISYHEDAIIGVWVGNADNSPMIDVSGVSGAGPIWHYIAEYMIERGLIQQYPRTIPKGVIKTSYCLDINCYQKILRYSKKQNIQKSRPYSALYFESDFVKKMTDEEKKKWKINAD